jgi:MoaA/NifB/PqqE/SkfB family radical SAM enzyme
MARVEELSTSTSGKVVTLSRRLADAVRFRCQSRAVDLERRWGRGWCLPALMVAVEPTSNCNLRCSMCPRWGESGWFSVEERGAVDGQLSFVDLARLVDELRMWRPTLYVTGGEPLLSRVLVPFCAYASRQGLRLIVNTNGLLLENQAKDIVGAGVSQLIISIDGPERVHDEIRGVSGSWRRALAGIEAVQSIRGRREALPRIQLNCTISSSNQGRLKEVVELALDLRVDSLNFQHLAFIDEATFTAHRRAIAGLFEDEDEHRYLESLVLADPGVDSGRLWTELGAIAESRKEMRISVSPALSREELDLYYDPGVPGMRDRCFYPWHATRILSNGDVSPCLGYVVGNIRENRLSQIWNGEKYRHFRSLLVERGLFPGCARCCHLF